MGQSTTSCRPVVLLFASYFLALASPAALRAAKLASAFLARFILGVAALPAAGAAPAMVTILASSEMHTGMLHRQLAKPYLLGRQAWHFQIRLSSALSA